MRGLSILALSALITSAAVAPAQAQQCPVGSLPWVDSWGNHICRRMDGSTATTEVPRGQTCPTGSYPWTDDWGNRICRKDGAPNQPRTDYYDTSKGCPAGTHNWVDDWGNKVCKPF